MNKYILSILAILLHIFKVKTEVELDQLKDSDVSGADISHIIWVIAFLGSIVIFGIVVIVIVCVVRKVKKIREQRRLSQISELSSSLYSTNRPSRSFTGQSSTVKRTTTQGSSSNISGGKGSSTNKPTFSGSLTNGSNSSAAGSNTSSGNKRVNYYRDVKITAV